MLNGGVCTGPKPKRRPGGGFDDRASDDSDFDDLRQIGGFRRGMQSASAKSVRVLSASSASMHVHTDVVVSLWVNSSVLVVFADQRNL